MDGRRGRADSPFRGAKGARHSQRAGVMPAEAGNSRDHHNPARKPQPNSRHSCESRKPEGRCKGGSAESHYRAIAPHSCAQHPYGRVSNPPPLAGDALSFRKTKGAPASAAQRIDNRSGYAEVRKEIRLPSPAAGSATLRNYGQDVASGVNEGTSFKRGTLPIHPRQTGHSLPSKT